MEPVSDIHTDIAQNFAWVEQLSRTAFAAFFFGFFCPRYDDVSEQSHLFIETLSALSERFGHVSFTPGNHDLWFGRRFNPQAAPPARALRRPRHRHRASESWH
jgi:UDP-2,3-diacylglucosamine pyrophosphatase LpxH